jgi:hypothetical protein
MRNTFVLALLVSMATGMPAVGRGDDAAHGLAWNRAERSLALSKDGRVLWQFRADGPKPFFHPVALASGEALTWESPPDHPWHRGIWFSWKFIDGVNYWEEDKHTGESAGVTDVTSFDADTRADFSAAIRMRIRYRPRGATNDVLTEERTIVVSAPDASGACRQDWKMEFTAGDKDVKLDRTPLPSEPGGKTYGGYAGLGVRFAREFTNWQIAATADTGAPSENRMRFRATATDVNGQVAGQECGIAILDHPRNLNAPSPWYVILDPATPFAYCSPAVIQSEPHVIPAAGSMTLRYRVLVHPGRWSAERLKAECDAFVQ